jgi:hypothetical protein
MRICEQAQVHYASVAIAKTHYEQLAGPLTAPNASRSSVKRHLPLVILRETAPQHFEGGFYTPAATPKGCLPLPRRWEDAPYRNAYNEAITPFAARDGLALLPIWQSSAALHMEHVAPPRDCVSLHAPLHAKRREQHQREHAMSG